jgi:hypothetical protein
MKPKKKGAKPAPKPDPSWERMPRFVVRLTDDEYEIILECARFVRARSVHQYVRDVLLGYRPEGFR